MDACTTARTSTITNKLHREQSFCFGVHVKNRKNRVCYYFHSGIYVLSLITQLPQTNIQTWINVLCILYGFGCKKLLLQEQADLLLAAIYDLLMMPWLV